MHSRQLLQHVQSQEHFGVNDPSVLEHFKNYMNEVRDPFSVFRYMEEKGICTFLAKYWIFKAACWAQYGDYRSSFKCLEEAQSRNGMHLYENQEFIKMTQINNLFREKLKKDMNNYFLRGKRPLQEFYLFNQEPNGKKNTTILNQKLLKLYEEKYKGLQQKKQKEFQERRFLFPDSWFNYQYQPENKFEGEIEKLVHSNSVNLHKEVEYHIMHTPARLRTPHQLIKSKDSAELLRRKWRMKTQENNNLDELQQESISEMKRLGQKQFVKITNKNQLQADNSLIAENDLQEKGKFQVKKQGLQRNNEKLTQSSLKKDRKYKK